MLNKMRVMARPIIWAIAIVFVGGMALIGIKDVLMPKAYVGIIAGQKIKYEKYSKMLQSSYDNYRQNPENEVIDEKTYKQLNNQTWNQLVQSIIFDNAIKKYNIKVSNKEVADKILNEPPDMLKENPNLHTDGKFDKEKYITALQNPETGLMNWLENYYSRLILYEKLMDMIKSTAIVSDAEVKKDYIEKNTKATADIMVFSPEMTDSVEISEDEIADYYKEHKENYKKDPQRKFKYVKIPLEPSPADIKAAESHINEIYQIVIDGEDFAELAKEYSVCPSAPKGGDLGFFGKGKMDPAFEKQAFSMEIGEISKPLKTSFGWHIIKLTDIRSENNEKEVQASHILIKEEPGAETRRNLETIAFDFYEQCKKDSFHIVAENFKYELKESSEFKENSRYVSGIGQVSSLIDFAFSNKLYAICEPYRTENDDYFVAMISYKIGDHYDELEKVKGAIKSEIELNKKMQLLAGIADSIATDVNKDNFYEIAEKNNLEIVNAKPTKQNTYIRGIGREEGLALAILDLKEEGKISDLIKGKKGYFLAKLLEYQPADMEKFEKDKDNLKNQMLKMKEDDAYKTWYDNAKEAADIKDRRSNFFRI